MGSNTAQECWESFCFLTTESVLIPSLCSDTLNVFYFNDTPNSLKHVLSLLLPETVEYNKLRHIHVRSQPTPAALPAFAHHSGDIPPFSADPDEAIVILSMKYRHLPEIYSYDSPEVAAIPRRVLNYFAYLARANSYHLTSVIEMFHRKMGKEAAWAGSIPVMIPEPYCTFEERHRHTSLNPLDKRTPHLHADQWVMHSRWGLDKITPLLDSFAYGSRYLSYFPGAIASSIAVYDFNILNERRGLKYDKPRVWPCSGPGSDRFITKDQEWDYNECTGTMHWPVYPSRIVVKPTIVNIPNVFMRPFTTALPYRVTETELKFPWDSAMIDGERIIGLRVRSFESMLLQSLYRVLKLFWPASTSLTPDLKTSKLLM